MANRNTFKTLLNPHWIYSKIISEWGVTTSSLFNPIREQVFDYSKLSYDGQDGHKGLMHLLKKSYPDCIIPTISIGHPNGECKTHSFILWKSHGRTWIIDPAYKQLLIRRIPICYGDSGTPLGENMVDNDIKFFSPYATYLYNLPPVLVSDSRDIKLKMDLIKEKRENDAYHEHDIIPNVYLRL
jgi:hypothetical protein